MQRMRQKLRVDHGDDLKVYCPANTQAIQMRFTTDTSLTIAGSLASEVMQLGKEPASKKPKLDPSDPLEENMMEVDGGPPATSLEKETLLPKEGQQPLAASDRPGAADAKKEVEGILVEDSFGTKSLIAPSELAQFTRLEVCTFEQTQRIVFAPKLVVLAKAVEGIFSDIVFEKEPAPITYFKNDRDRELYEELGPYQKIKVCGDCVIGKHYSKTSVLELSWSASPLADMVADSVVLLALELTRAPSAVQALGMSVDEETDFGGPAVAKKELLVDVEGEVEKPLQQNNR